MQRVRRHPFISVFFSTSDSFEAVRTFLLTRSAFVVRGAADKAAIARLAERAQNVYRAGDHKRLPEELERLFNQGHMPASELGDRDIEGLANSGYLADMLRSVCRWENRIESPRDVLLRRILPPWRLRSRAKRSIELHQDEYFSIISDPQNPPAQPCFTLWIPLVPCGLDAPGLSVVLGSGLPIVHGAPPAGWKRYIRETYGPGALWSPSLDVGDVLVFTSRTIHGSYVRWRMTKPRYSLEIRGGIN